MTTGKVYLVGAGPGDPGLLTLRGAEVLAQADLVLYDGLANPLILQLTPAVCERTARTRVGSERIVPQKEINDRLIAEARAGQTVVRLKGGDPFIFGRGGEEAAALEAAEIPFEVVPGITAATAAGEYAGFSFTHRECASAVAFVTGHEDPTRAESRIDYAALANFPGTLVFYMGLGSLQRISDQLIQSGLSADTPAAVICRASLPSQRIVVSTLKDLPAQATVSGMRPPSLIVVGDCVERQSGWSWFDQRPLSGQRIGITRPKEQCAGIAHRISLLRGEPVIMPLITIGSVSSEDVAPVLQNLHRFDWLVFTSVNGVSAFMEHLWASGQDTRALGPLKIAAIGTACQETLKKHSLRADLVPASFRSESLAECLAPHVKNSEVLWAKANRGRDILSKLLAAAGASVTPCVVYRNEDADDPDEATVDLLRTGQLEWVGLSSPSIARRFARLLDHHQVIAADIPTRIASISPITSTAATEAGLTVAVEATTHTWDGIVDAIVSASTLEPNGDGPSV